MRRRPVVLGVLTLLCDSEGVSSRLMPRKQERGSFNRVAPPKWAGLYDWQVGAWPPPCSRTLFPFYR